MWQEDTATVISTMLLVSGLTTILHTFLGSRLPLVQGSSFVYLAPALVIANSEEFRNLSDNVWFYLRAPFILLALCLLHHIRGFWEIQMGCLISHVACQAQIILGYKMPIYFGFKLVAVCKVGIGSKSLGVRRIPGAISPFIQSPLCWWWESIHSFSCTSFSDNGADYRFSMLRYLWREVVTALNIANGHDISEGKWTKELFRKVFVLR